MLVSSPQWRFLCRRYLFPPPPIFLERWKNERKIIPRDGWREKRNESKKKYYTDEQEEGGREGREWGQPNISVHGAKRHTILWMFTTFLNVF